MFYGMPIHIIRDVAITVRSFYKRISDFIRYRQATKDMNARYPDATLEEIRREDVCIICRELMHVWQQLHEATDPQNRETGSGVDTRGSSRHNNAIDTIIAGDDRLRPKKLPCGHILHCACLRSWLERQQICPTCRAPVLVSNSSLPHSPSENTTRDVRAQEQRPQVNTPTDPGGLQRNVRQNTIRLGPFSLSYGIRQDVAREDNIANRAGQHNSARSIIEPQQGVDTLERLQQAPNSHEQNTANFSSSGFQGQLLQLEQQLLREINSLRADASRLYLIRMLEAELARIRIERNYETSITGERSVLLQPSAIEPFHGLQQSISEQLSTPRNEPRSQGVGQRLPGNLVLPNGWNVLSLHRVEADGGNASAFLSLPIFSNRDYWDPVTPTVLPPTYPSVPFAVNYPLVEQQHTSQYEGTSAQQSGENQFASAGLANIPPLRDDFDAAIQLVRNWDGKEVGIGQDHTGLTTEGIKNFRQDIDYPQASSDSGSLIASGEHSSICTNFSDQQVKAGNEEGSDELKAQGDGHLGNTLPVSRGQWKGKGKFVNVEDTVEEMNVD
jgi:hypothetical protein